MITIELESVAFGGGSGPGVPLPAARNRTVPASTTWTRAGGRNQLVYACLPWLAATGAAMNVEVTLATRASQRQDVWISTRPPEGDGLVILGRVQPTRLTVHEGEHRQRVRLALSDAALGAGGVGKHVVSWIWQFAAAPDGEEVEIGSSDHDVFVILDSPAFPWTGEAGGRGEIVWTDVLEWSCRWATGAECPKAAATKVAQRLNGIGGLGFTTFGFADRFRWFGRSAYTGLSTNVFECSAFLSLLSGETNDAPAFGNCLDLAAAVVTFANALGCNLQQGYISAPGSSLALNEVRLVGLSRAETQDAIDGTFPLHFVPVELSRTGTPAAAYDALVEIDEDDAPGSPPSTWLVAAGLPFRGTSDAYVDRVVRAAGVGNVRWRTTETLPIDVPTRTTPPAEIIDRYERYLDALRGRGPGGSAGGVPGVPGYFPARPVRTRPVVSYFVDGPIEEQLFVMRSHDQPEVPIWVSVIACASQEAARQVTAELLAWTSLTLVDADGGPRYLADAAGQLGGYAGRSQSVVIGVAPGAAVDVRPLVAALALAMA